MALTGLLDGVTQEKVRSLLLRRETDLVEEGQLPLFEERVTGAGVEVVVLVGADPAPGPIRTLAVEAVAFQTASEIEYAEYPEQQKPGGLGRGWGLHQRYLELLQLLRQLVDSGVDAGEGEPAVPPGGLRPQGSFPPARPYPDPVEGSPCW